MTTIQIILVVGGVLVGAILLALMLSRRPTEVVEQDKAEAVQQQAPLPEIPHITEAELARLQTSTQEAYRQAVAAAAKGFHQDLATTSTQLNKLIVNLTTDVVERELEDYRVSLANAREQAIAALRKMESTVEQKQTELEGDMDAEMVKRRQYLMDQLDKKLGAAVAAYIVESLGIDADLGAQRSYLLANLERHRDELKREITSGTASK